MPLNCVPSEAVLTADDVLNCYKSWSADAKVALLLGLSTLELCLVRGFTITLNVHIILTLSGIGHNKVITLTKTQIW